MERPVEAAVTAARNKVVWWGVDPHADIAHELGQRGLVVIPSEDANVLCDRELRVVLIPFLARKGASAIAARARRLRADVVDRGGTLFVVTFHPEDHRDAVRQTAGLREIGVLDGRAAGIVAQACAGFVAGTPEGDVVIKTAPKTKLGEQDELLLRRAFGELSCIEVRALGGGLSGASIWQVEATKHDGRKTLPFLAKVGPLREITEEIDTTKDFVVGHIPFTNRPGLVEARCVAGVDRRVIVSDFVEKSERFDDYVARTRSVEKVVRSIYTGPLRNWRSNATVEKVRVGMEYVRRVRGEANKHAEGLQRAHVMAQRVDTASVSPEALLSILEQLPEREIKSCQAHGDLHPRNIFVRDNSEEIILIDFAKAGDLGNPILRDTATLDVALAFDGWERAETRVGPEEIDVLYTRPLFGIVPQRLSHRAATITFVREQAKIDAIDEHDYAGALVAMLLRTARLLANADSKLEFRAKFVAAAIRCADRLAKTLP